jgi:hypothetical protein
VFKRERGEGKRGMYKLKERGRKERTNRKKYKEREMLENGEHST